MQSYWKRIQCHVDQFLKKSESTIEQVAEEIYKSLVNDGIWHLFGSGHSALVVEEAFHRSGGLVQVNPMTEVELSPMVNPKLNRENERRSGLAEQIFGKHSVRPHEPIFIISNSGINSVSIEMAIAARAHGLRTWAVTCVEHSRAVPSRHPSGKRLFEVADGVIDTLLPPGDVVMELNDNNVKHKFGAASLVMGATLIHTIETLVIQKFVQAGQSPPIYISSNMPGGDDHNKKLEAKYASRILRLQS